MFVRKISADEKARPWVFIIYPESAPIDWVCRLQSLVVPAVVSPLHNGEEGEDLEGKPHYHCMLSFSSPASAKKVLSMLYSIGIENGIGGFRADSLNYNMIQPASNQSSYIRYMCHLDQPDKQRLKWSDMIALNGMDIDAVLSPGFSQELDYCNQIIEFCEQNDVYYFYDLVNYARRVAFDTWFVFLKQNSYFIKEYLRSKGSKRDYKIKKALLSDEERKKLESSEAVSAEESEKS